MGSQLDYILARDRMLELARRAERVRQTRSTGAAEANSRARRLFTGLLARSKQRELPLTQAGVEGAGIAGGCFEVE